MGQKEVIWGGGGGVRDLCCSHQVPIGFLSSFKHVFQVPIVFHNTPHPNKKPWVEGVDGVILH